MTRAAGLSTLGFIIPLNQVGLKNGFHAVQLIFRFIIPLNQVGLKSYATYSR